MTQEEEQLTSLDDKGRSLVYWNFSYQTDAERASAPDSLQFKTAKIALVGDTGVGKTGLGTRLAKGAFKPSDSTHGQQFWEIPALGGTMPGNVVCEAILWDFAGQQDYRLVHSLFLDDVSLALILFDPTDTQDPLKGVDFWVSQLKAKGSGRKMILVGARLDRGAATVTREELENYARRNNFSGGYVGISSKTGEGVPELIERIKAQLIWNDIPAVVTTPVYRSVRELILSQKGRSGLRNVTTTVSQLCTRISPEISENELRGQVKSAIRHLAAHGYVYLLEGGTAGELILLQPDILINLAASMILEARRNPRGLGFLEERALLRSGYAFPEISNLDKTDGNRLIAAAMEMFLTHNICFRESIGPETLLVFPALINLRRPLLPTTTDVEEDITYRVRGETENLYAALVVLLGYTNTFTRTNQWHNQAEYELRSQELCGFHQVVSHDGQIDFVIYYTKGTPDRAKSLFRGLFESFLHGRNIFLQRFDIIICPDCGERQARGAVIARYAKSAEALFCAGCGYRIKLPCYTEIDAAQWTERQLMILDREVAQLRTEFEAAMVRVKSHLRSVSDGAKDITVFLSYAWGEERHSRWIQRLATDLRNAGFDIIFDQWHATKVGESITRFVEKSASTDYVLLVGTPAYLEKYSKNENAPYRGSVLAAEVDIINQRLIGNEAQKRSVLPIVLEGDPEASLPQLVRGRVFADFRREQNYFVELFNLVVTIGNLPYDTPGIPEQREALKASARKLDTISKN